MKIPLSGPEITQAEIDAVSEVLRSGRLSLGPKLQEFEAAVAAYCGTRHGVGVSSGTAGLHLCVRALGIGEGDEVILPSFSFVAAANVLRYERAMPVFVDIDPLTLDLDPAHVEAAITPRTRALLIVHTFGVPAEIKGLLEIARRHNLIVIEDACEAIGAECDGQKVGAFGEAGVFAFYPNKQITTAEGGMVVTNHAALASRIKSLRNQGRSANGEWLQHGEVGFNYRLSELHCALGVEQLKRIDGILQRREEIARGYHQRLARHPGLELPPLALPNRRISWFVFVVRLRKPYGKAGRDALMGELAERGIETAPYFAPIHLQAAFRDLPAPRAPLSITESIGERTVALPFFNRITDSQMDEICAALWELLPAES